MSSYSATMIVNSMTGKPMSGSGSFANINIDGRHSLTTAIEVARDTFKKESGDQYMGFAIERTERFVAYRNPKMVDTQLSATEVAFLL